MESERLREENKFLKMKLMLENGANFYEGNLRLPPALENMFLRRIVEFEKQFATQGRVTIYEKLGRPTHFRPVSQVPDEEMDQAWEDMYNYLAGHNISVDVCSPHVSTRELYRFVLEELFQHEVDDLHIPGMMQGFVYDEFHPDPVYENSNLATESCIYPILSEQSLDWLPDFEERDLRLNGHFPLLPEEFMKKVNQFKLAFDGLEPGELDSVRCLLLTDGAQVTGNYALKARVGREEFPLAGSWRVRTRFDPEINYWRITEVEIGGLEF